MAVKKAVGDAWGGLDPKVKNTIVIVLVIIIILIIWRNKYKIQKFFTPKAPNMGTEEQLQQPVLESRKIIIHSLAGKLEKDINNTGWSHDYTLYSEALGLADNELIYLADYWKSNLSPSESLYDAIGGEYYTWDWSYEETPWELQNKLAQLGKR